MMSKVIISLKKGNNCIKHLQPSHVDFYKKKLKYKERILQVDLLPLLLHLQCRHPSTPHFLFSLNKNLSAVDLKKKKKKILYMIFNPYSFLLTSSSLPL